MPHSSKSTARPGVARLGTLLQRVRPPGARAAGFDVESLRAVWPRIVGEANAGTSWVEGLSAGVLSVVVPGEAAAKELGFLLVHIARAANLHLGRTLVRNVRVYVGTMPGAGRARTTRGASPPLRPLDESERGACRSVAGVIRDEDLRAAFECCMGRHMARSPRSGARTGDRGEHPIYNDAPSAPVGVASGEAEAEAVVLVEEERIR